MRPLLLVLAALPALLLTATAAPPVSREDPSGDQYLYVSWFEVNGVAACSAPATDIAGLDVWVDEGAGHLVAQLRVGDTADTDIHCRGASIPRESMYVMVDFGRNDEKDSFHLRADTYRDLPPLGERVTGCVKIDLAGRWMPSDCIGTFEVRPDRLVWTVPVNGTAPSFFYGPQPYDLRGDGHGLWHGTAATSFPFGAPRHHLFDDIDDMVVHV